MTFIKATDAIRYARVAVLALLGGSAAWGKEAGPAKPTVKDELRLPWTRGEQGYIRHWLAVGPFAGDLATDYLDRQGGEAGVRPRDGLTVTRADGSVATWHGLKAWSDTVGLDGLAVGDDAAVAYAFAEVNRPVTGKALLSVGSDEAIRVWLNGKLVLSRDGVRALVPDEDQVEVDMLAGPNRLLVKLSQTVGPWSFCARVLEAGSVLQRRAEIGPAIVAYGADGFTLRTDVDAARPNAEAVRVEVIGAGGKVFFATTAARGARLAVSARAWPDGPYEVRSTSHRFDGRRYASHLPWYKGDSLAKVRALVAAAAAADAAQPEGFTLKMLAELVEDRLGGKLGEMRGNPWWKIHAPLMEYDELMLDRSKQVGRIRPYGFVRLAYRDEVDGSPQFCRAYLPAGYDPARKWPLVVQMHGYNPDNPVYVRWWSVDQRHHDIENELPDDDGIIYVEPHGRGNTWYLGMGDSDVVRAIAEAKRVLSVDDDRVYLTGDSMGGWGTWNIASRHPQLFAAIAPVFGGKDYHAVLSEPELRKLGPLERFLHEKQSTFAMAEALSNLPIYVRHGDRDQAVDVAYSRWATRLLERWGFDVRYHEYPGRGHEALESESNAGMSLAWFLRHRREPNPRRVRIRSADLRHAAAYWAKIRQANNPLAFMVLDAEIVDRNVVRLDTDNVLDVVLSPSAALLDAARPVRVVWNGAARAIEWQQGRLHLAAPGYAPAAVHKQPGLPGTLADFTVTPFAVVVGTTATDPEMAKRCQQQAKAFIDGWRMWQKHEPRVFNDTEIRATDIARYSLLLIGGPDANRVTAQLASGLPLQIAKDRITIDGNVFRTSNAAVHMLYPNPRNGERYVWVVAGTSAEGMSLANLNPQARPDWDYVIADRRTAGSKQRGRSLEIPAVAGVFDYDWRFSKSLVRGAAVARSHVR